MFLDPDTPDFDTMSQDELIAWLEMMEKRQRDKTSLDFDAESSEQDAQPPRGAEEEWDDLLNFDETMQQAPPSATAEPLHPFQPAQNLAEDDDETPTALDAVSDDTTDPLNAIADKVPEAQPAQLDDDPDDDPDDDSDSPDKADKLDDPFAWLDPLAKEVKEAAANFAPVPVGEPPAASIDAAKPDLESDEDESLYSQRVDEAAAFPGVLIGFDETLEDEFSTQSLAPVPDFLAAPDSDRELLVESESASADQGEPKTYDSLDSLTQAFLMQNQQAELEAWYAARLRTVAADHDTVNQAPDTGTEALKAPPPGLAAGFNSARGKIAQDKLEDALGDYETLLRANIGLDLVVSDMQWLIKQAEHRDKPAVHRVLGDALMRQGQLQQALDVYRHALKLL